MNFLESNQSVVEWLLEPKNPSVRYHALLDLLGKGPKDANVVEAREQINRDPWVVSILDRQKEKTYWETRESCYVPKWSSTVWQLLVLADLGVTVEDERVRNACEFFLMLHRKEDGGFSAGRADSPKTTSHICLTGNIVWALLRLGYVDDVRVWRAIDWLLSKQMDDGGWNC